jgi:hypothetical protein
MGGPFAHFVIPYYAGLSPLLRIDFCSKGTHHVTDDTEWPRRMRTDIAARYLTEVQSLPVQPKTLRNWRAAGRGPACRYMGTLPIYDRPELDLWAIEDALKSSCPTSRKRQPIEEPQDAA